MVLQKFFRAREIHPDDDVDSMRGAKLGNVPIDKLLPDPRLRVIVERQLDFDRDADRVPRCRTATRDVD